MLHHPSSLLPAGSCQLGEPDLQDAEEVPHHPLEVLRLLPLWQRCSRTATWHFWVCLAKQSCHLIIPHSQEEGVAADQFCHSNDDQGVVGEGATWRFLSHAVEEAAQAAAYPLTLGNANGAAQVALL